MNQLHVHTSMFCLKPKSVQPPPPSFPSTRCATRAPTVAIRPKVSGATQACTNAGTRPSIRLYRSLLLLLQRMEQSLPRASRAPQSTTWTTWIASRRKMPALLPATLQPNGTTRCSRSPPSAARPAPARPTAAQAMGRAPPLPPPPPTAARPHHQPHRAWGPPSPSSVRLLCLWLPLSVPMQLQPLPLFSQRITPAVEIALKWLRNHLSSSSLLINA